MIDTLLGLVYWFARPSIAAWAGAVATLVACFLADPRRHIRRPIRFLRKVPRILIIWLIIAWLLSQLGPRGLGGGGTGGGKGESQGAGLYEGQNYGGTSTVVRIRFLPAETDTQLARDFTCLVRVEPREGITREQTVKAGDLLQFEQELQTALRHIGERPGKVIVERQPFPGEGALKRIHAVIHRVWPDLIYEEVEP
jgi:hypothetical protein